MNVDAAEEKIKHRGAMSWRKMFGGQEERKQRQERVIEDASYAWGKVWLGMDSQVQTKTIGVKLISSIWPLQLL